VYAASFTARDWAGTFTVMPVDPVSIWLADCDPPMELLL